MGFVRQRLERAVFGDSDARVAGRLRALKGLREGDRRELLFGLGLLAFNYARKTAPSRQLLYRKSLPPGTALVIHHTKRGRPRLQIIRPKG